MALKDCIGCALKILEEEKDFQKQHGWLSENLQSEGQCPIRGERDFFNIDLMKKVDKTRSLTSQSSFEFVSPCHQIHREVRLLLPIIFFFMLMGLQTIQLSLTLPVESWKNRHVFQKALFWGKYKRIYFFSKCFVHVFVDGTTSQRNPSEL